VNSSTMRPAWSAPACDGIEQRRSAKDDPGQNNPTVGRHCTGRCTLARC
jgi:hypothetical protein